MANYDSFVFEGHGKSEVTGAYDPGAVGNGFKENDLSDKIVAKAKNYLDANGLTNIHYDENNYIDLDLAGNTYKFKCGTTVHINAGGGSGVEIYVPLGESYLQSDFDITANISLALGIPNRGVKSRDYDTERTITRTNGVKVGGKDYYKEIRDAWGRGISLSILEVGFIDTGDVHKINANIDRLGYEVAKYIATNCGVTLKPYTTPTPPPTPSVIYRVLSDGKQVGAYSVVDNAVAKVKECLNSGAKNIQVQKG